MNTCKEAILDLLDASKGSVWESDIYDHCSKKCEGLISYSDFIYTLKTLVTSKYIKALDKGQYVKA